MANLLQHNHREDFTFKKFQTSRTLTTFKIDFVRYCNVFKFQYIRAITAEESLCKNISTCMLKASKQDRVAISSYS